MAKVRLFMTLRALCSARELNVDASTIEEVLEKLADKFGDDFVKATMMKAEGAYRPRENIIILLNGRNIEHLSGLKSKVRAEDVIAIFPPVGGGAWDGMRGTFDVFKL